MSLWAFIGCMMFLSFVVGLAVGRRLPKRVTHKSDCATNNAPAKPPGPCDCGAE